MLPNITTSVSVPRIRSLTLQVFLRTASRSDPGSCQIAALVMDTSVYEILGAPFKVEVSISPNPVGFPKLGPLAFKSKCSGVLFSQCRSPMWGSELSYLWVAYPWIWDLIISQVHSSYLSHCGSFFVSLVVEDLFQQVPVFFKDGCLQIVVILVCSQKELSSGSFYSVILVTLSHLCLFLLLIQLLFPSSGRPNGPQLPVSPLQNIHTRTEFSVQSSQGDPSLLKSWPASQQPRLPQTHQVIIFILSRSPGKSYTHYNLGCISLDFSSQSVLTLSLLVYVPFNFQFKFLKERQFFIHLAYSVFASGLQYQPFLAQGRQFFSSFSGSSSAVTTLSTQISLFKPQSCSSTQKQALCCHTIMTFIMLFF